MTASALRGRPFHQAARTFTNAELRRFAAGARVFDAPVPEPGAPTTVGGPPAGLGPRYIERSCIACHVDGGIVPPSAAPTGAGPGALVRVGLPTEADPTAPDPGLGHQVQHDAVDGTRPEATVQVSWEEREVEGPDGPVRVRAPRVELSDLVNGPLRTGARLSLRVTPTIVGLGLLEAVPESTLTALADPDDANGDGVSGRVARLADGSTGRFGWKAAQPTVRRQSVIAASDDLGLTTPDLPDPCADQPVACPVDAAATPATAPELAGKPLDDLVIYTVGVAPPVAAWTDEQRAGTGAAVFEEIGCSACHAPRLRTGGHEIAGLAGRTIHPFTDLLLHDLGPDLADGLPEGGALASEWRTAPLWGLGRRAAVYGYGSYLHDGRARTVTEAILWHGGEAQAARDRFNRLPEGDREALLAFLKGL